MGEELAQSGLQVNIAQHGCPRLSTQTETPPSITHKPNTDMRMSASPLYTCSHEWKHFFFLNAQTSSKSTGNFVLLAIFKKTKTKKGTCMYCIKTVLSQQCIHTTVNSPPTNKSKICHYVRGLSFSPISRSSTGSQYLPATKIHKWAEV